MRTALYLAAATCLLLSCQSATDNQAKKEDLKNLLSEYYSAMANKDLAKMKTLTTPDFVMYDDGIIYSNESAIKTIETMPPFKVSFLFDSINAHIDKVNASAYYLREANFVIEDSTYAPIKFLESSTFKKEGNSWKLRFLHSSMRK